MQWLKRIFQKNHKGKLNRMGYLTIEIILASVIAFAIAFFLIEITMKLVNITDDYYLDTVLVTDKSLITKNIKRVIQDDINTFSGIIKLDCNAENNRCDIFYEYDEKRTLRISDGKIEYVGYDEADNEVILYSKGLNKNLNDIKLSYKEITKREYEYYDYETETYKTEEFLYNFNFIISAKNIFSNNDYSMVIPITNDITPIPDYRHNISVCSIVEGENNRCANYYAYNGETAHVYGYLGWSGYNNYKFDGNIQCENKTDGSIITPSEINSLGSSIEFLLENVKDDIACNVYTKRRNTYKVNLKYNCGTGSSAFALQNYEVNEMFSVNETKCVSCSSYPNFAGFDSSGNATIDNYLSQGTNNLFSCFNISEVQSDVTITAYFIGAVPEGHYGVMIYLKDSFENKGSAPANSEYKGQVYTNGFTSVSCTNGQVATVDSAGNFKIEKLTNHTVCNIS